MSDNMYVMVSEKKGKSVYMPMYIHTFKLHTAYTYTETVKFQDKHQNPDTLTETSDKLRYLRHTLGWYQSDMAQYLGIPRAVYANYETVGNTQHFPIELLEKVSGLFKVDITYLMDDYNLFLYRGQGEQIKQARLKMGLSRCAFADMLHIHNDYLYAWESGTRKITKKTYEKIKHVLS